MTTPRDDAKDTPEPAAVDRDEQQDREAILARRARFVATALAGLTVLPACDPRPQPCLEAPLYTPPSGAATPAPTPTPPPMPCLSPVPAPPVDRGTPAPCLEVAPPPPPPPSSTPDAGTRDAGTQPPRPDAGRPAPCLLVAPPRRGAPPPEGL